MGAHRKMSGDSSWKSLGGAASSMEVPWILPLGDADFLFGKVLDYWDGKS